MIVKKCLYCGEYFPAEPLEICPYCPKHHDKWEIMAPLVIRSRNVPIGYLDIYDTERPIKSSNGPKYERVCRVCAKPLLNREGKYIPKRRYCEDHFGYFAYSWTYTKMVFTTKKHCEQKAEVKKILREMGIPEKYAGYCLICEECGKPITIRKQVPEIIAHLDSAEIHHIIPIHLLDADNLKVIFDLGNLKCLCRHCHKKQEHRFELLGEKPYRIVMLE